MNGITSIRGKKILVVEHYQHRFDKASANGTKRFYRCVVPRCKGRIHTDENDENAVIVKEHGHEPDFENLSVSIEFAFKNKTRRHRAALKRAVQNSRDSSRQIITSQKAREGTEAWAWRPTYEADRRFIGRQRILSALPFTERVQDVTYGAEKDSLEATGEVSAGQCLECVKLRKRIMVLENERYGSPSVCPPKDNQPNSNSFTSWPPQSASSNNSQANYSQASASPASSPSFNAVPYLSPPRVSTKHNADSPNTSSFTNSVSTHSYSGFQTASHFTSRPNQNAALHQQRSMGSHQPSLTRAPNFVHHQNRTCHDIWTGFSAFSCAKAENGIGNEIHPLSLKGSEGAPQEGFAALQVKPEASEEATLSADDRAQEVCMASENM